MGSPKPVAFFVALLNAGRETTGEMKNLWFFYCPRTPAACEFQPALEERSDEP
jgi:hypothetical protein